MASCLQQDTPNPTTVYLTASMVHCTLLSLTRGMLRRGEESGVGEGREVGEREGEANRYTVGDTRCRVKHVSYMFD